MVSSGIIHPHLSITCVPLIYSSFSQDTMKELIFVVLSLLAVTKAQIPGVGWCPDKRAMAGFDIDRYLGTWYEAERYFTVLEAGSRCARTNYTKAVDGRILVTNEIRNRLTGIKRVLDGEIRNVPKGGVDSKISVKYSTLPFPMETEYIILDTDYDTYSVVWSCSGLGPLVNTQSAWVMTRERLPPGTVLQKAYAVLDKHKISRTFFVRAEQEECNLGEAIASSQKTRSNEPVNQNVESSSSSSGSSSSEPAGTMAPTVASETPAASVTNEEQKKVVESEPSNSVESQHQTATNTVASGNESNSSTGTKAEAEATKPVSADTVRKPSPAVTAGPPAASQENAAAGAPSNQNSPSSTSNSVAGASEQKKN